MGWGRGMGPCLYCLEGENRATPLGHMHSAGVQSTVAGRLSVGGDNQPLPVTFCLLHTHKLIHVITLEN